MALQRQGREKCFRDYERGCFDFCGLDHDLLLTQLNHGQKSTVPATAYSFEFCFVMLFL